MVKKILFPAMMLLIYSTSIGQSSNSTFDAYVNESSNNVFTEIAGPGEFINKPNDLDFNPDQTNGAPALWVINEGTVNSGGTTVTILNPGEANQSEVFKKDGNSWHFMSLPTGLAFGDDGTWANSPGVFDANHNGSPFTGPSLWASDFSVYAVTPPGGNGSHLDMLHQSPYSMGIAHEKDNVYWVFDGYHQTIVMYDFAIDHGPGNSYHDDGRVHFIYDFFVKRDVSGLPSHLVVDKENDWLYIVDNGNSRILRMKIGSGSKDQVLPFNLENLAERWSIKGTTWEEVATGLNKPCGIDVFGDRLVVTDNGSNEIIIYDISTSSFTEVGRVSVPHSNPNIRGVKVDPQGNIWFVDYTNSKVFKLTNDAVVGIEDVESAQTVSVYPNPAREVLNLSINSGEIKSIRINSIQGSEVMYTEVISNRVDVSFLKEGIYLLTLTDDRGNLYSERFIKQ